MTDEERAKYIELKWDRQEPHGLPLTPAEKIKKYGKYLKE